MKIENNKASDTELLLKDFFSQDDLPQLIVDVGRILQSPVLVLNDAFRVIANYRTDGFHDDTFQNAVQGGEITYEVGALISQSEALSKGKMDEIQLTDSCYKRRFIPLICSGVRLGYLICVDMNRRLEQITEDTWCTIEWVLAKQLFIEVSHQDKLFETAEDILIHLLDGGFTTTSYFRLQIANTYLADFHPYTFALIDLTAYDSMHLGRKYLKEEINEMFPVSHPFLYKGNVFLFLQNKKEGEKCINLAKKFQLKIVIADKLGNLYDIPMYYRTANEALMIRMLQKRKDLVVPELVKLAEYDKKKETQYCETLYWYLACNHSLKKTCDMLFTHRNTILYRIRRMQEEFDIPLQDNCEYIGLLLGVAVILFDMKGAAFFVESQYDGQKNLEVGQEK